jgi:hypothetical protein
MVYNHLKRDIEKGFLPKIRKNTCLIITNNKLSLFAVEIKGFIILDF